MNILSRLSSRLSLAPLLLTVVFGLFAGAVGTLLVLAYSPVPTPSAVAGPSVRINRIPPATEDRPEWADLRLEAVARATVLLYRSLPSAGGALSGAFIPADAVGAATVLTSDGWLISYESVLAQAAKGTRLVAVVGGKAYPVRTSVTDSYSGAAFLRIDAANLPVASFGDDAKLRAGDALYAIDAVGGLRHLDMTESGEKPAATPEDYVVSSERIAHLIRTGGAAGVLSGSAAVSRDGGVVGIYAGADQWGASVIPLSSFFGQISSVLRDGKTLRPALGVRFIDLSRVAEVAVAAEGQRRGALLAGSSDGKTPAVGRKSAAETAGLRVGDTILAIGSDEVTANRSLSDIIAEYDPGTSLVLTVRRGPVSRQVDVKLGTVSNQVR